MTRTQLSALVVVAVVGVWLAVRFVDRVYITPRAEVLAEIDDLRTTLAAFGRNADDAIRVEGELRRYADRTLGGTVEEVDHHVRTRLNRIAERIGLADPAVGTGNVTTKRSPARRSLPRGSRWKTLRDEADFLELEAWVTGRGSLEQSVQLIDQLAAERWISRIDHIKLDPKDAGEQLAVSVRVTTLVLPGRAPSAISASAYDDTRLARFTSFVSRNPFRIPVAPPPPPPTPEPETTPPAAPYPYGDWMLTGVAIGPDGDEVWLRNMASGETKRLTPDGTLEQVKLADISRDAAVFELDGSRFQVLVGHRLDDRVALKE